MLYNYFIFLCIGAYASSKPICDSKTNEKIRTQVWELQNSFCKIEQNLLDHLKAKETPLQIPGDFKKKCAKFHLEEFSKLLNQSTEKLVAEHYDNMVRRLENLADKWPHKEHDNGRNCQMTLESNLDLHRKLTRFVLEALPTFLCLHKTTCSAISEN